MPRKLRTPKERVEELSPDLWHYLRDGELPQRTEDPGWLEAFIVTAREDRLAEVWAAIRAPFLAQWIDECPGRRPSAWWLFDAPRWERADVPARCVASGSWQGLPEPRLRVGGVGTPAYEVLNYAPEFRFGIPTQWVDTFFVDYYNGRARDVNGRPIGTQYQDGHFVAEAYDAADPPTFESQAAYLERHGGLLSATERRRLPAGAFDPEVIRLTEDDEDKHAR